LVDGSATLAVRLGTGSHKLKASYGGDADFLASISAPVTIIV
jgi:hypothetical protein